MEAHKMIEKIPEIFGRFFSDENQERVGEVAECVEEATKLVIEVMNDTFGLGVTRSIAPKSEQSARMYSYFLKEIDKMEVK